MQATSFRLQWQLTTPNISDVDVGPYITQMVAGDVTQLNCSLTSINHAFIRQTRHKHALTIRTALVHTPNHLISHQRGKRVSLIIKLIESVFPKHVEDSRTDEEPTDRHPESICERREGKSDNENGK